MEDLVVKKELQNVTDCDRMDLIISIIMRK